MMSNFFTILCGVLLLTGCVTPNEELQEAGKDVVEGSKEIVSSGAKVIAGGKVIIEEAQEIIEELRPTEQPEDGETVWVRQETQGCEDQATCFSWRESVDAPWQLLQGQIHNLDDLPAQIDNWQVKISALNDFVEAWKIEEILPTDGE